MKAIGIVICNYNKSHFVTQCIRSVLESKEHNFDIYVVDNASTDDSVERIKSNFGDRVTLIENTENLGGSGGFNTGLRIVRDKGYEYFLCLDDDAQVDETAIQNLYQYMEENPDVGMAGCRVYHAQMPEYIQQCGVMIDFEDCSVSTLYADVKEEGRLPEVIECDAVATCAVMVRGKVIRETEVGLMPEDNFIYWDDMEWGHRMHLAGYRTVTLGNAKALHQMGANERKLTTFVEYYMWRNRLHFFMKYTPKEKWERMSVQALGSIFDVLYEKMYREEHNQVQSIYYAYQDALEGIRGKAETDKILPNDAEQHKLVKHIQGKKSYHIREEGMQQEAFFLRNLLKKANPSVCETSEKDAEVIFHLCPDIFRVSDFSLREIYVDIEQNCILDQSDVSAVQNYEYSKMLFIYLNQGVFLAKMRKMDESVHGHPASHAEKMLKR